MEQARDYSRLIIITGSFGSGKSEFAINLALQAAREKDRASITLVDLDLVNAFFRVREVRRLLDDCRVQTIIPREEILASDLPIPGPGIEAIIKNPQAKVIIDVGGDDMGATALRSYRETIMSVEHDLLLVVNPYRPFTRTVKDIIIMKEEIEYSSGLKIHRVISNPNSGMATSLPGLLAKHDIVLQAAEKMALPVVELLVYQDLFREHHDFFMGLPLKVRPIQIYLTPEWLVKQQKEDSKKQWPE